MKGKLMTTRQQKTFIRGLCNTIRNDLAERVKDMPDTWDGHELRELLALAFERSASMSVLRRDRCRMREFRNTVCVQNL